MKLLLVSALVAVAFGAHPEIQSWDDWKATFEVTYKTKAEHDAKKAVFHENIAMIATHNALADKGLETYRLGVNQFTDLTQKEWSDMYLGGHQHFEKDYADLSNIDAPDSVDWRTKGAVTPVKNQGQCGSCWSFSTTGSIEGAVAIASGTLTSLSEQQLMDCSGAYGDHSCEGGLMDNAFKYVIKNGGLDSEADYPYKMRDEACNRAKEASKVSTIKGYKDVQANENDFQAAVAIGPVSIAIEADQSSFQHYRSGVFTGPCGDNLDHGVLTVGYTQDYFIVKNSWGATWGDEGFILMSRSAGGAKGMCGMYTSASYPIAGTVGPTPPPTTPGPTPPGPSPSMPYYEDPAKGPCNTGEQAIQIQGIDGAFCSPKCQGFLRKCPPAPSSFEGGQGECALQDQSGDKYCAVICDTSDANACDASLQSTCKSAGQGTVGLCTYNDDSDKPLTRLSKSTLKTVHHKKISTHEE